MDKAEVRSLRRLRQVIELLRGLEENLPAQTISVFLLVATNPGTTMRDLQSKLGAWSSTVSRNISALSTHKSLGVKGLGLVEAVEDPADRRYKVVNLTIAGEKLAGQIAELLKE